MIIVLFDTYEEMRDRLVAEVGVGNTVEVRTRPDLACCPWELAILEGRRDNRRDVEAYAPDNG